MYATLQEIYAGITRRQLILCWFRRFVAFVVCSVSTSALLSLENDVGVSYPVHVYHVCFYALDVFTSSINWHRELQTVSALQLR